MFLRIQDPKILVFSGSDFKLIKAYLNALVYIWSQIWTERSKKEKITQLIVDTYFRDSARKRLRSIQKRIIQF